MSQPAVQSAPSPDLAALRALVKDDMARVNTLIIEQSQSDIPLISELASHLIAAGGKRLRPCLTIAAAKLCGYEGARHVRLAASVEFIHTATLLHDDVVDDSHLRRGEATANALWGNKSSVLVGDFLFSRAFQLMVADGSLDVLKVLSDASAIISAGEVHQLTVSHDLSITRETYEQVIAAKTAALFAAACEIGPIVSEQPQWREALRGYGHALGMAFQLADDALDYMADEAALGKAIGDDFRDGKVTLPVLLAYEQGDAAERKFWEGALEDFDDAKLAQAKALLKKYKTCEATIARAEQFVNEAVALLKPFPASDAKAALIEAAEFSCQRAY
jgi:octaprenyl-diphosphate synthase